MTAVRSIGALCLAAAALGLWAASAGAADQIYWGNEGGNSISHANVAGGDAADRRRAVAAGEVDHAASGGALTRNRTWST